MHKSLFSLFLVLSPAWAGNLGAPEPPCSGLYCYQYPDAPECAPRADSAVKAPDLADADPRVVFKTVDQHRGTPCEEDPDGWFCELGLPELPLWYPLVDTGFDHPEVCDFWDRAGWSVTPYAETLDDLYKRKAASLERAREKFEPELVRLLGSEFRLLWGVHEVTGEVIWMTFAEWKSLEHKLTEVSAGERDPEQADYEVWSAIDLMTARGCWIEFEPEALVIHCPNLDALLPEGTAAREQERKAKELAKAKAKYYAECEQICPSFEGDGSYVVPAKVWNEQLRRIEEVESGHGFLHGFLGYRYSPFSGM